MGEAELQSKCINLPVDLPSETDETGVYTFAKGVLEKAFAELRKASQSASIQEKKVWSKSMGILCYLGEKCINMVIGKCHTFMGAYGDAIQSFGLLTQEDFQTMLRSDLFDVDNEDFTCIVERVFAIQSCYCYGIHI